MCLVKRYGQHNFFTQIMYISFVFWLYFGASCGNPEFCVGVLSNIAEWDKPVDVNPQEILNQSHPNDLILLETTSEH